jgi:hypothetical protein
MVDYQPIHERQKILKQIDMEELFQAFQRKGIYSLCLSAHFSPVAAKAALTVDAPTIPTTI